MSNTNSIQEYQVKVNLLKEVILNLRKDLEYKEDIINILYSYMNEDMIERAYEDIELLSDEYAIQFKNDKIDDLEIACKSKLLLEIFNDSFYSDELGDMLNLSFFQVEEALQKYKKKEE